MAATKKILNSVSTSVDESLSGLLCLHPGLRRLTSCPRVIVRADIEHVKSNGKVTIVIGGGSGHEPLFAGYVGPGMASCAVHGNVFASPGSNAVLSGLRVCGQNHHAGVLLLINNYTGDRLNFGLALEKARSEGIQVENLVVGEDCAVMTQDKTAGRRGLAGCILIYKIAGALAEMGESLPEIVMKLNAALEGLVTLGVCLTPCSLPGSGPLFKINQDEMEIGLGLHGEAGVKTMKMMSAHDTVQMMLDYMSDEKNSAHLKLKKGMRVAVLINNLGAMSDLEINIVVNETVQYLDQKGVAIMRAYAGRYCTSQEMAGFSITLLNLSQDFMLEALDFDAKSSHWVTPLNHCGSTRKVAPQEIDLKVDVGPKHNTRSDQGAIFDQDSSERLKTIVDAACSALLASEKHLNDLDSGAGDGDCGATLADGAKAIQMSLPSLSVNRPSEILQHLASVAESSMGGCSGALYSLLFTTGATQLQDSSPSSWLNALDAGITAIRKYGGAEPGDRTMLDALCAASGALKKEDISNDSLRAFQKAVEAAHEGAQSTIKMAARAGRASYVSADHVTQPDPGAVAAAIWLTAAYEHVTKMYKDLH